MGRGIIRRIAIVYVPCQLDGDNHHFAAEAEMEREWRLWELEALFPRFTWACSENMRHVHLHAHCPCYVNYEEEPEPQSQVHETHEYNPEDYAPYEVMMMDTDVETCSTAATDVDL